MPKTLSTRKRRGAKASIRASTNPKLNIPGERSTLGENFRKVLGLVDDKEGFEVIKKHLRTIMDQTLDWSLHWHEQTDANLEDLESQTQKFVPSIHETKERKVAARRYMATYFRNTRWNIARRKHLVEDHNNSSLTHGHRDEEASEHASAQELVGYRPKRRLYSRFSRSTSQRHAPVANVSAVFSERISTRSSQNIPGTRYSSQSSSVTGISQTNVAILNFLRACRPSLEHLMPVFNRSTMNVKSLSLAFQIAEQYEVINARRAGPRAER